MFINNTENINQNEIYRLLLGVLKTYFISMLLFKLYL